MKSPMVKIAIRVRATPTGVKVTKTKHVTWRSIAAFYEDGRVKDVCGEVWEVRKVGDHYEAIG